MPVQNRQRIARWVVLCAMLGGVLIPFRPAGAQGDEGQPDTGRIYAWRTELLFPSVIRFLVEISAPLSEIDSVTLTLRQESGLQHTIPLDLESSLVDTSDLLTTLLYVWDMSETSPVPFESLNYRWQVETADMSSTASSEIVLEDSTRFWNTAGQPPVILHWHNGSLAGGSIQQEILAAYDLLTRRAERSPLFHFVIYDPGVELCQKAKGAETGRVFSVVISREDGTKYPCSVDTYRQLYAKADMVFIQRTTLGYAELEDTLVEAMVAQTYTALWGTTPVPAWFLSGLERLYRLRPTLAALQVARTAARTDSLLPVSKLETALPDDAAFQQRSLWEAQSHLLVLYLADRYGAEAPFRLARSVPRDPNGFEGALAALTGGTEADLWTGWREWLLLDAADRAVLWTPYSATTPTPSATPTATAVPPTFTPSPTRTETPSPTSTFLGDQPPTVVVIRVTPTRPSRPTNTPLPPGSLPTVTPRSAPAAAESGTREVDPVAVGGIVAVVAGILVLAGLIVVTLRRRG